MMYQTGCSQLLPKFTKSSKMSTALLTCFLQKYLLHSNYRHFIIIPSSNGNVFNFGNQSHVMCDVTQPRHYQAIKYVNYMLCTVFVLFFKLQTQRNGPKKTTVIVEESGTLWTTVYNHIINIVIVLINQQKEPKMPCYLPYVKRDKK